MRFWRLFLLALMALALAGPALTEPPYDTVNELSAAVIPPRDRIDLARRLLGVTEIAPPPASPPQYQLGDTKSFWVTNEYENRAFQVTASLRTMGEHIYFWVQEDVAIDPAILDELAAIFDRDLYQPMRDLFGSEDTPGIDGDPRVYGLFAYGQGPGIAAYFASEHIYPIEAVSTSNQHEMFFFNLDTLGTAFPPVTVAGVVAHEFQHMIQERQDTNESIWLNEGFSKFSEVYTGYQFGTLGAAISFLTQPHTQLNTWPEDASTIPHYGASLLFITYFYDRFGADALRALARHPASGLESVNQVLQERRSGEDVNSFFADWVLANYLQNTRLADGRYGYRSLTGLTGPTLIAVTGSYPYQISRTAAQYSTDYFVFNQLTDQRTLDLRLDMPETVQLIPTTAASGQRMWYSNKADNSDTTLTRRFDLRAVSSATLHFNVWYHIENLWDYGYVMVSADDGLTWTILDTPHKTTDNPHNNAYGPGYTGFSGGWLAESLSLDAYAGQEILLRFEMITDDATTQPGMVIDDVRIPEIGYAADFEADAGGWEAQGWILTDNRLPQQAWVQIIQQIGPEATISRHLASTQSDWTLNLKPGVQQVMIAISPFAPLTTVPMPYALTVAVR
jgi:hypothetical protein